MSGRSAYVRQKKTAVGADGVDGQSDQPSSPHDLELRPKQPSGSHPMRQGSMSRATSSSGYESSPYARVQKPHVPQIEVTGITKSNFRSMLDQKSEDVRKGLVKTFSKKNRSTEGDEGRPTTASTARHEPQELEAIEPESRGAARSRHQVDSRHEESGRAIPPYTRLPVVPQATQLRQWRGSGSKAQAWDQPQRDTELWNPNGDTLIFCCAESEQKLPGTSAFRVSSSVLEATRSPFFLRRLREGVTHGVHSVIPDSPPKEAPRSRHEILAHPGHRLNVTPPPAESSTAPSRSPVVYELCIPNPPGPLRAEIARYQVTTRNVLAVLYHASLVGFNLTETLTDLHARLQSYMPSDVDAATLIIDYLEARRMNDVRGRPATAAALLAWSEHPAVRWEEGWREFFVHCTGMYHTLDRLPEYKQLSPVTRALLERGSLDLQLRVRSCVDRLRDFDFSEMWVWAQSPASPSRAAFDRLQTFLRHHYQSIYHTWPPASISTDDETWLTRPLAQELQGDFGALYNYLVNRDVVWDGAEERSGRKWNIINPADRSFQADSLDVPFTDILIAFDNRHHYPHIPHPYPLVPDSLPPLASPSKITRKSTRPAADIRLAERKASLAYTEATNIYILSPELLGNDLVEAFISFEKSDRLGDVDPYDARRGRWLLIYGVLQTLATIAVDTPKMRYTNGVKYHLSPRLRGTPPWRGAGKMYGESEGEGDAMHEASWCWTIQESWKVQPPVVVGRRVTSEAALSMERGEDAAGKAEWRLSSRMGKGERKRGSERRSGEKSWRDSDDTAQTVQSGFSPRVGTVEEWVDETNGGDDSADNAEVKAKPEWDEDEDESEYESNSTFRRTKTNKSDEKLGTGTRTGTEAEKKHRMERDYLGGWTIKDFSRV